MEKTYYTKDDFRSIIVAVSRKFKLESNRQYNILLNAIDGDKQSAESLDHRKIWLDFIDEKVFKTRTYNYCNSPSEHYMDFILDVPTLSGASCISYEERCLHRNAHFHDCLKQYLQSM